MSEECKNENEAIIAFAKEQLNTERIYVEVDGIKAPLLVLPDGHNGRTVVDPKKYVDQYRKTPERREGVAILRDIESFIAHANRFKDAHSVLFADPNPKQPLLQAVLDYHESTAAGAPRFGKHRSRYAFPLSDQWQAWTAQNEKGMGQAEFAMFIEDRIADVAEPGRAGEGLREFAALIGAEYATPSRLLDLSRGLTINVDHKLKSQVNLSSGEAQMVFEEKHAGEGGSPIRVPGAFIIGVPIFQLGTAHLIGCRLRYRAREGAVTWSYSMYRVPENFDVAIREECAKAQAGTDLPLLYGTPE